MLASVIRAFVGLGSATLLLLALPVPGFLPGVLGAQQAVVVTGTVVDAVTGEGVSTVRVELEGAGRSAVTQPNGSFQIEVPGLDAILVFSRIGYERLPVELEGRTTLRVELGRSSIQLEELVVVGYGSQRRRDLTGAVASISRADIAELPVYSIENLLQGMASGVEVTANGYRPGQSSTIRIRGTRSLSASNDPLFVVDGVPVEGGIMDLAPQDIESIEILKDASSTAIYGSRGANGVILITSTRGFEGPTRFRYSGSVGTQRATHRLRMMDAERYAEMKRQAEMHQGTYTTDESLFEPFELRALQQGISVDWQDLIYRSGTQHDHQLSITGGTDRTRVALSGSYTGHEAIAANNDYARYSSRVNLDHRATDRLNLGVSALFSHSITHQGGSFGNVVRVNPMAEPWDEEGNLVFLPAGDPFQENPLFDFDRQNHEDQRRRSRVLANLFAEVDLRDDLSYRLNFAPDLSFARRGLFRGSETIANALGPADARVEHDNTRSILLEHIVDFNRRFLGEHLFQATGLYSMQLYNREESMLAVRGLPYEHQRFHNLGTAIETTDRSSRLREWALESYMLRLNYSYSDRYIATLTGRVDGSSRLAEGNKHGFFPSAALAWRVIDEPFLQDLESVSELKLRLSYGMTGNTAIQPYQTQGGLSRTPYNFGGRSVFGFENRDIANPSLQWETTTQLNLGVDVGLMDNRFAAAIEVYQADTDNLLMARALPATSGYSSIIENVGSTRNRGVELSLSSVNFTTAGGLTWSTNLNVAANRNQITSLYGGLESDPGNGWFVGSSINSHFDYQFDGIWQLDEAEEAARYGFQPGDIKLRDLNGDGRISSEDRVILGSPDPSWTLGMTNRVQYGPLDVSALVYTAQGVMVNSGAYGASVNPLRARYNSRDVDFWTPDNPSNEYPRPQYENRGSFQNALNYRDGSYLRVRNITLGYRAPGGVLSQFGLAGARAHFTAQNPFTFTSFEGYDPEGATGSSMPNYRTFMIGVEISH
ncbi:MAG: TonB-dependent receptor [Gemmatimonadales bacterium]|nr:MAG: TonB-dependent receptor [Gemmatimonadales bacterium]